MVGPNVLFKRGSFKCIFYSVSDTLESLSTRSAHEHDQTLCRLLNCVAVVIFSRSQDIQSALCQFKIKSDRLTPLVFQNL